VLVGSEVKSLFLGRANLTDAYCLVRDGELWLHNLDIEPYTTHPPFSMKAKDRKLLMHRKEIDLWRGGLRRRDSPSSPARCISRTGRAKVEVALARGKSQYDKRDRIAKDEARKEIERARNVRE